MKSRLLRALCVVACGLTTMSSHAELVGRLESSPGSGIFLAYFDDQLNITWAADANINDIRTWTNANSWAEDLAIGGVGGWRLPNMDINGDSETADCSYPGTGVAACADNEYGYLYWVEGISAAAPGPFHNIQGNAYWSSSEFVPSPLNAWSFSFYAGNQSLKVKDQNRLFAWAVHDGDVPELAIPAAVPIDIEPGKNPNIINLKSGGFVTVAVLTQGIFDALQVDPDTTKFGLHPALAAGYRVTDVDRDGDEDLLLYYRIQQTDITCSDPYATLTGELYDGTAVAGTDSIQTKNCQ